jgi:glucosyl-dolichyl phosphate glucuronosyltransferase
VLTEYPRSRSAEQVISMGVSITIQTYNRAEELRTTLRTLALVDTREVGDYEIIVVDNNSSDHTPRVVSGLAPAFHGKLRYVSEPRQGLSCARNRAIAEARYDVVAFLDDDVNVHPKWLRAVAGAFASGDYAAIGGRALLVYPAPRPGWLGDRSEGLLTKMDYGLDPRPASPDELYGVNLSIRKNWLRSAGGFRTDLGRVGTCLIGSEETDLLERIVAAGGRLLYSPSAAVGHRVDPSRLRRRWFWSRCYWGHRGLARVAPGEEIRPINLLRWAWRSARSLLSVARATFMNGPTSEEWFYQSRVLASRFGYWVGLMGRRFRCDRILAGTVTAKATPMMNHSTTSDLQHQVI